MYRTITKIENQKKDNKRNSIYIDGVFAFGLSEKMCHQYQLKEGIRFTEEEYKELITRLQLEKAKYKALDYIAYSNRSKKQVKDKLKSLEYEESIIEQVLLFLEKYHYVDDERFALRYLEQQMEISHKSFRKVIYELYQKGIKIDKNLDETYENIENKNIRYFLEKYGYTSDIAPKEKDKIIKRILSKGFSYNLLSKQINKLHETFDI